MKQTNNQNINHNNNNNNNNKELKEIIMENQRNLRQINDCR